MPDDNTNANMNNFDTEPASGHSDHPDTSEHADIKHRLEADAVDERPVAHSAQTPEKPVVNEPAAEQPVKPSSDAVTLPNPGPGLMVLQWLVYAFWGWTVLALSGLVVVVVNQLLTAGAGDTSEYDAASSGLGGIAYLLAAVIVLFIISIACDIFYARAERSHARGTGTNVIMIIHAVIFALFGIGALITSVFGAVSLMIGDSSSTTGAFVSIISGAIIFILYGFTLLRTLRPTWMKGVAAVYWLFMTVAILIAVTLGVVGPAQQARLQAQDDVIEQGLPSLVESISEHTADTGSLPKSLDELTTFGGYGDGEEARKLVKEDLVEYTPGEKLPSISTGLSRRIPMLDQQGGTEQAIYHYKLCVTYKTKTGNRYEEAKAPYRDENQKYDTTVSTYSHDVGRTCYDLQTDYVYNYDAL